MYLFGAVDSHGDTVDFYLSMKRDRHAAKTFLQKALSNRDNQSPRVLYMGWKPDLPRGDSRAAG
jgi:IS6 family transposase